MEEAHHDEDECGIGGVGRAGGEDCDHEHEAVEGLHNGAIGYGQRGRGLAFLHNVRPIFAQPLGSLVC